MTCQKPTIKFQAKENDHRTVVVFFSLKVGLFLFPFVLLLDGSHDVGVGEGGGVA